MFYLIAIPHQSAATLEEFKTKKDLNAFDTHDLYAGIYIESQGDLQETLKYEGHKKWEVRSLAQKINLQDLEK